jgi:hypothetical protein
VGVAVNVGVVVPWIDNGNTQRRAAQQRVTQHLRDGGYQLYVRAPVDPEASPGAARNAGAAQAISEGCDLLVFNDADSIVSYRQLDELVATADAAPGLVFGYSLYKRLDREMRCYQEIWAAPSMGCVAIQAACFDEVGGFEMGFQGWGYEDVEFANRCAALWPLRRVEGPLYHLWHGERRDDDSPTDSDPGLTAANLQRLREGAAA